MEQFYLVAYFNNIETQCHRRLWRFLVHLRFSKKATSQLSSYKHVHKHTCKVLKCKTCWETYWFFNTVFNSRWKFWCFMTASPIKITEQTYWLAVKKKKCLSSIHFYDYKQNLSIINPHGHNRWLNWRNALEVILLTDVLNY